MGKIMNILNKIKIDAFLLRIEKRDLRIDELEKQVQERDDVIQEFVDQRDATTSKYLHLMGTRGMPGKVSKANFKLSFNSLTDRAYKLITS